ncbi:hypothetical protein NQ317_001158 [Molorchus minor]|uniref:KICSTOR complex protein ITFG2-like n=1 Tax=Molorchus minor TaxID=1323400 RepID=A0ABQ9JY62_9CUCU|nr:hypothetical protein NQ317_001158 [Molorchus minor]
MRAISLVKRIKFEFTGNVVRDALTLGDIDNDGCNELIVGNQNGEVVIFKGQEKYQTIIQSHFVSCVAVGNILNDNRNVLIIITADGWCYLYAIPERQTEKLGSNLSDGVEEVDGQNQSTSGSGSVETLSNTDTTSTTKLREKQLQLICIHQQRIPANAKFYLTKAIGRDNFLHSHNFQNILLGDVDGDGLNEMVLGLTDRVVRSYRWINSLDKPNLKATEFGMINESSHDLQGKFVALNKWECANQIGSITLHHSWDGRASLLIAQPGGTFMRIRCSSDDSVYQTGFESSAQSSSNDSQSENISSAVDYQFLGISRMRNQNISTEILGDLKSPNEDSTEKSKSTSSIEKSETSRSTSSGRPYAVATLDGTIMLVQDEIILWAIAVDHQVFALTKLDVTGNGSDDIVVCSWDGQTYILDQEKNSVRFHLEEPVQAFTSGYYNLNPNEPAVTCLVYVTFKNTIILYYDIPLKDLICKKFEPDIEKLSELFMDEGRKPEEAMDIVRNMDKKTKQELVDCLLYKVNI